jgi:methylated-DNA-[protein]-cysteine S-methyltransferase
MNTVYYTLVKTDLGDVGVIWRQNNDTPAIVKIFLPFEREKTENVILGCFPASRRRSHGKVDTLCTRLLKYLAGDAPEISLNVLDMSRCTEFQKSVFKATRLIPKGMVSTYRGLAERIGIRGGARAVGTALASNPFPLVVPCHRVIRTGGSLGGFGGGLEMKKALLEVEGVLLNEKGRVLPQFFW